MLFIGLTMLGIVSYHHLSMELYPDTELSTLYVQVTADTEIDPKYVEQEAIIPLEGVVGTLAGVDEMQSQVSSGSGVILVYLTKDTDVKYAYLQLVQKIESAQSSLPDEFTAQVVKMDMSDFSSQFMQLQVLGEGGVDRVRAVVDNDITDKLESVDGVAGADVYGGREKSVEITVNNAKLDALGITISQIKSKINNFQADKAFVGRVKGNGQYYYVNVTGEYNDINDLKNIVVKEDGNILLKDVADVVFGVKEQESYSRVNGKETVSIRLSRESNVNLIDLSHAVRKEIDELNEELAKEGVEISISSDSAETMEDNINNIINLALVGGLLAVFILWIFLKNMPLVSVVMLSIPISVFSAFNAFYAFGISINTLTLIGIALAIGMLIDNSVVVMENIYRIAGTEDDKDKAVLKGTKEVYRAILASTFTTIAVFLPFAFSTSTIFQIVATNISVSIVGTLLVSLVVAILLIPMLTHSVLGIGKNKVRLRLEKLPLHNRLIQAYVVLLKNSLRAPARTLTIAILAFFAAIFISLMVSNEVNKEVETPEFVVSIERSTGSTLENTDKMVRTLEGRFEDIAEKDKVISQVYDEEATITIQLDEDYKDISDRTLAEIKADIEGRIKGFSDSEITVEQGETSSSSSGGFGSNPGSNLLSLFGVGSQSEDIVIKGEDYEKMMLLATDLKDILEDNMEDEINSASVSVSSAQPEAHINFDPALMSMFGVTPADVATEVASFQTQQSSGGVLTIDNVDYDIVINDVDDNSNDDDDDSKTYDDLKKLEVENSSEALVPLKDFSKIILTTGQSKIVRVNQQKQVTVTYSFTSDINDSKDLLEAARAEVDQYVNAINLPSGVAVEVVHEEDQYSEFYFLIGTAFILVFMILASVYESFVSPFVILFSIPLAAIGSMLALIFTGNSLFNLNTLIGFLILLGVVVNNGIILLDYSRILRYKQGMSHARSLIEAGISRVRPILITASTTVVAMMPLALGKSEYVGSLGAPFAITVVGGLVVSTLLTLVFIPTFSFGLENSIRWIKNLKISLKLTVFGGWILGFVLVQFVFDHSLVWKLVEYVLFIAGIPAILYFVLTSLKQANVNLIDEGEPIQITLQNLVKIYERDSRFIREWKVGKKYGDEETSKVPFRSHVEALIWQLPLFGFVVWMTWFYTDSSLWQFLFILLTYYIVLSFMNFLTIIQGVGEPLKRKCSREGVFYKLFLWLYPLGAMAVFGFENKSYPVSAVIIAVWYLLLLINYTGRMLLVKNINIERLSGRFKGIRRQWYLFVRGIPVIGHIKQPFRALKGVSFTMKTGMIGLLGPNGAGKSTLMRIICGILDQSYGKIFINNYDTTKYREELQGLIGFLPQEFGSYENMSSYEFLDYMSLIKGIVDTKERKDRIEYVLKAVHMWERKDDKIGSFSGGMKQRIGIAQIMLHLPKILVVDEPTAGLDPSERIRFRNLLVELSRNRIVIFSTHIIEDISSSCNQVAVMKRGELKYWGNPQELSEITKGKVWTSEIPVHEFEDYNRLYQIVHHIGIGDKVKIRILSDEKPFEGAEPVLSSLEDSYLWLLRNQK